MPSVPQAVLPNKNRAKVYYCRESEPNSCKSRALSLPVFQYNGHTWPSGDQPAGKVNQIPVKTVHFPGTLIRQLELLSTGVHISEQLRRAMRCRAEQCGIVPPKPRPDLTFVFAIHCKSRINNIHIKKLPWIPRAS